MIVDNSYSIIDKIHLYVKDPNETKYQHLTKKREKNGVDNLKNLKDLIKWSNNMLDFYKNIEEYNPDRECNTLIVFDDTIADMNSNKIHHQLVTELFNRGRKLNISIVFITKTYFAVPKYENSKQVKASINLI